MNRIGILLVLVLYSCDRNATETIGFQHPLSTSISAQLGQYYNNKAFQFVDWSPDGGGIFYRSGNDVLHQTGPQSNPTRYHLMGKHDKNLVIGRGAARGRIFFSRDRNGNEDYQIYSASAGSESPERIVDEQARHTSPWINAGGDLMLFKSNLESSDRIDLYLKPIEKAGRVRKIFENITDDGRVLDWAPDGQKILLHRMVSKNETQLFELDLENEIVRRLSPQSRDIAFSLAQYIPNSANLVWASDENSEFQQLFFYQTATLAWHDITPELAGDITALDINREGSFIAFASNNEGLSSLHLMKTGDWHYSTVKGLPAGRIRSLQFEPTGNRIAFSLSDAFGAEHVYVYNPEPGEVVRWTHSDDNPDLLPTPIAMATPFQYPTYDTLASGEPRYTPAFLYAPPKRRGQSRPVLIDIHGGPEAQAFPDYNAWHQYLVNELGIAVIRPNIRGSSGYGKTFRQLDDGIKREGAIRDVGHLLEWIKEHPELDEDRVMISGESYGGYVVLAVAIRYPNRIRAGISGFGVSNWVHFLEQTSGYRRELRRAEYGDERKVSTRQFLRQISPVHRIDEVQCPLLIIAGCNDPRVPIADARALIGQLQKNGKTVLTILGKREGHGFKSPENQAVKLNGQLHFIEQFLLN